MNSVKTIIFDLGGVILDIDFKRTFAAFEALGVSDFETRYSQYKADDFFINFEKGKVSTQQFFDKIREMCGMPITDDAIRNAWDALLIAFPEERVQWLLEIRKKYPIYLFSNTNIIHYQWFSKAFYNQTGQDLNPVFVKAYYSHEMGMRKPDAEGYQLILAEQKLNPAETLFIDDTLTNIEAAQKLGLQTVHLIPGSSITRLGL